MVVGVSKLREPIQLLRRVRGTLVDSGIQVDQVRAGLVRRSLMLTILVSIAKSVRATTRSLLRNSSACNPPRSSGIVTGNSIRPSLPTLPGELE